MNLPKSSIAESDPALNRFLCAPWPDFSLIQVPAIDNAQTQAELDARYSDHDLAAQAGTGAELPPIGPGKYTLSYDEALEWIADQQPRPQRPDPQAVATLRAVRKLIDRFNPVVARVVLQIIAAGFECWPPEMIAAAPDDQLKEMLEAASEFVTVRLRQQPDDEPPEPPPADRQPHPTVDRRQELREARVNAESRGPPEPHETERKGARLTGRGPDLNPSTGPFYAGSYTRANPPSSWVLIGDALRAVLLRFSAGGPP